MKKNKNKNNNLYVKTYLFGVVASLFFIPFFVYAQTTYSQDLFGLFEYLKDIIDDIVLWLFTTGAVLAYLFYITYQIFLISKDGKMQPEAKRNILFGLIALTLMFTFYAVAGLLATTFGFQLGIPQFYKEQDGLSPGSGNVERSYSVIGR